MANRRWGELEIEVRSKVTKPMPVNRIITKCGIQYSQFQKLVHRGILIFVDSEKQDGGSPPKRYIAVDETKLRTNPNE